ncbi:MAG: T9SS type A sorting domain-containing protein [Flavobacteriales bacterium]|nr:T9SS type A sorting domain-containing protein [Flavobacteriales bacterium]
MRLITVFFSSLCAIAILFLTNPINAQQVPVGEWQIHLPYHNSLEVAEAGSRIYCATGSAVFYYDKTDEALTRMSKVSGLSDVSVSSIAYQESGDVLVIAYSNANIDVLKAGVVYNVSDIKRKSILGDKSLNSITVVGNLAYIASGFGIVVLDLTKIEIKDTYYISVTKDPVNQVVVQGDTLYAASDKGLYKAFLSGSNLSDFNSWSPVSGLDTAVYVSTTSLNGNLYVVQSNNPGDTILNDSVFVRGTNGAWSKFHGTLVADIHRIESSYNKIVLAYGGGVNVYDESGNLLSTYTKPINPRHAIFDAQGNIWIADFYAGLIQNDRTWGNYPGGPASDRSFAMAFGEEDLWVAPGGRTGDWNTGNIADGIFTYKDNNWSTLDFPSLNNIKDFIRIVVDPNNKDRVFAGSWGFGVVELNKGALVNVYNESNTDGALQSVVPGAPFNRIGGLDFDTDGNLWVTSTEVEHMLCVRTVKGSWHSYEFDDLGLFTRVGHVLVDEQGYKWILIDKGGIVVFDDNGTLTNTGDDREERLINAVGSGNVSLDVVSIAEDLDGEIWVGTNEGIYVFYSPSLIFTNDDYDAQRILVEQDGYFQYLLETEAVSTIAIDGANRKWLGTESAGAFLMSEDGTTEVLHFTAENSPLLSNNILNIAINHKNGEVFFGTEKGIVSYKGTATEGAITHTNVYAYPNPVREDYTGTIAIKGLVTDAAVKITDVSGTLIYETTAFGGQAVWDGKNFSGDKAQTGIYLVFATNDLGTATVVTKIMFIN